VTAPRDTRLTALLRLLDDESPVVREKITEALAGYGGALYEALSEIPGGVDPSRLEMIRGLLAERNRSWLRRAWSSWFGLGRDVEKIETAMGLLAEYQAGRLLPRRLPVVLDELAEGFRRSDRPVDPAGLARYLFEDRGIQGAREDYYAPESSSLIHAAEAGRGIPITLVLLYILVGRRLRIVVDPVNFPGHFLARVTEASTLRWVDCYHGGRFLTEEDFLRADPQFPEAVREVLNARVSAETVLARVLNNLMRAYDEARRVADRDLMQELLHGVESAPRPTMQLTGPFSPGRPPGTARFRVGALVRHRRYGYRGVIVDRDPECRADEEWYRRNATQPDRNQPWYSVLVDGTSDITYAAQTNLESDPSAEPVVHPLVEQFFSRFENGVYVRNERPWPAR
jgi:heat shock protein HspQ